MTSDSALATGQSVRSNSGYVASAPHSLHFQRGVVEVLIQRLIIVTGLPVHVCRTHSCGNLLPLMAWAAAAC
jgi:hypothetical protein